MGRKAVPWKYLVEDDIGLLLLNWGGKLYVGSIWYRMISVFFCSTGKESGTWEVFGTG